MALTLTVDEESFHFHGRAFQNTKEKNKLLEPYGKILHNYGMVLSLLPDKDQQTTFRQYFGCARIVHNDYIDTCTRFYQEHHEYYTLAKYKKERLPELKKEKPFLKQPDKFALESAAEHADNAYQNLFQGRGGKPKHVSRRKPNGNRYTTKQTNNNICPVMVDGKPYIKLPKIGLVRFVLPKKKTLSDLFPQGVRITKATVSCQAGAWTVSLGMESIIDIRHPFTDFLETEIFAGDAGLKEFLIYGNQEQTEHIPNPRFIKVHEKRLRRFQKKLSRRQYDLATHTGSKNREKARLMVAKEQRKIANQRKDFHHKLSRRIADSCKVFIRENLNVSGMMKNHHLAKSIASVGWYQFFTYLQYKLEAKGGRLVSVDRFFPSSQLCSHCGYRNKETKDLKVREWVCPECGTHHDRDVNAKINLWKEGVRILEEEGVRIVQNANTPRTANVM